MILLYYLLCAIAGVALSSADVFLNTWEWWVITACMLSSCSIGFYIGKKSKEENNNENH